MRFSKEDLGDFEHMQSLEWIETNGLGGYSSGTVSGANSRRYHGLLVAATEPPVGRMVMLSKLEETIHVGGNEYRLGANQFPGALHPNGYNFLNSFEHEYFPSFVFDVGDISISKTIGAIHGTNSTVIIYKVLKSSTEFHLQLLALYAARAAHSLSSANDFIGQPYIFEDGIFRTLNYRGCPELFISAPGATFTEQKGWYYNFEYAVEKERGMDYREDLYTHGYFSVSLKEGDQFGIIISTDDPTDLNAQRLLEGELSRRKNLANEFSHSKLQRLMLAADQFIVKRGERYTVVAGYHWFSDWGRDTMISLPGLCLSTGRLAEARDILLHFSTYVSEGMIPNRFPDFGETPEYNTIDATLWYFVAAYQYYIKTADQDFLSRILPILSDIVKWHYDGTRYNIKVDPMDQLLSGGEEGVQLTWMDAKVGDWVVTPRRGKTVEINALWYNALCIFSKFLAESGQQAQAEVYGYKARKVIKSFNNLFWNDGRGCLYDYVEGTERNGDIRPNQIFAISLPFNLLSKDRARKVFDVVTKTLLTPRGLRSLAPGHEDYKPYYLGDIWARDGAYHQGTVWGFLIGPYIDALMKVKGVKGGKEATAIMTEYLKQMDDAGVGSISEIFDAEAPHVARGCIAQAWSIAEALRVVTQYNLLSNSTKQKKSGEKS